MKILTISTFPFEKPRHGGQHRLHNIVKYFQSLGHRVESVGVLGSPNYEHQNGFLPYPDHADFLKVIANPFLMDDLAIGRLHATSESHFAALSACIQSVPDVIHVELPWLVDFAARYRNTIGRPEIKIIYGSENVEHKLKQAILSTYLSEAEAVSSAAQIRDCELSAIRAADAICCVSQQDVEWTKQFTNVPCVLAANGVARRESTRDGELAASRIAEHKKFALYCASAHPPNIFGFYDIFSAGLGAIAPDQLLVVAGSAGPSIDSHGLANRTPGLRARLKIAGEVDEATLHGLLDQAHAVVLPITQGEGTNLKTAEAIWARKHVIATTKAMRGFEQFNSSPGIHVHDAPGEFLQCLQRAMQDEPLAVRGVDSSVRDAVLWESCLSSLSTLIH